MGRSGDRIFSMNSLLAENLSKLEALCRKHNVKNLFLFGSALRDDFDSTKSDLDFLVEFENLPEGQRADAYFGLLEELELLFHRRIDLITTSAVMNPYFQASLFNTRVPLYAAA